MKNSLAMISVVALTMWAGFGQPAFAYMSVYEQNGLNNCMRKTHAEFRTDDLCLSFMQKRGISTEEMDMIKACRAQKKVKDDSCMPLVNKYADIMLRPNGSVLSPGASDTSDR